MKNTITKIMHCNVCFPEKYNYLWHLLRELLSDLRMQMCQAVQMLTFSAAPEQFCLKALLNHHS